jgi:hypothetical protein
MPALPQLVDTDEREQGLRRYHILDTAPERDFDQITRTVAKVCDASIAQITLVDKERLWIKSCFGFNDARETPLKDTFAATPWPRRR